MQGLGRFSEIFRKERWGSMAAAAALVLLATGAAAVLRFWRLGAISAWGDEYLGCLAGLPSANPKEYWDFLRLYGTSQAPLHSMLEYFWFWMAGSKDLFMLRAPNVVLNLLTIPVAYGIGARLAGRTAGGIAAFCFAFSTMQIWHAQSIRAYSLLILLAGISLYSAMRLLERGPSWWWCVLFGVNVLVVWTHWLACFLVAAEFLALWVSAPERRRATVLCALIHGSWLLPLGWYIAHQPPVSMGFDAQLTFGDFYGGLLKEDIPSYDPLSRPPLFPMPSMIHWGGGYAAECMMAIAILGLLAVVFWKWGTCSQEDEDSPRRHMGGLLFLLFLTILLPVAMLAVLEYLAQAPFLLPRYVAYGALARYALFGAAVARCRFWTVRAAMAVVVFGGFAYQLALFLPCSRTTDYLSALQLIRTESHPGEWILVDAVASSHNLRFHMKLGDLPVIEVSNVVVIRDIARWLLGPCPTDSAVASTRPAALWHVYNLDWGGQNQEQWEQQLRDNGLQFRAWFFPGMEMLKVYRITCDPAVYITTEVVPKPFPEGFSEYVSSHPEGEKIDPYYLTDVSERLSDGRFSLLDNPLDAVCLLLLRNDDPVLAGHVSQMRLEQDNAPEGQYIRLLIRYLGNNGEGGAALLAQTDMVGVFLRLVRPFTERLIAKDFAGAFDAAERLDQVGHPWGLKLREIARRLRAPNGPVLPFGLAPVCAGDFEAIAGYFDTPNLPCATGVAAEDLISAETLGMMQRREQAAALLKPVAETMPEGHYLKQRWQVFARKE